MPFAMEKLSSIRKPELPSKDLRVRSVHGLSNKCYGRNLSQRDDDKTDNDTIQVMLRCEHLSRNEDGDDDDYDDGPAECAWIIK